MLHKFIALAGVAAAASLPHGINLSRAVSSFPRDVNVSNAAAAAAATAKVLMSTGAEIMMADFDGAKFNITSKTSAAGSSWLAYAKPDRLFAVDESGNDTTLFSIDVAGNKMEKKTAATGSAGVVHLGLSRDGNRMAGAGYGSSTVDIFDTSAGGIKLLKTITSGGQVGPVQPNQAAPHPHQAVLDPTGRYFAVNDLGTDRILILDSANDSFAIINNVPVEPAGCGPRHGAFFPVGADKPTHYMVVCEIKNLLKVYSLKYGGDKGIEFFTEQSLSTFSGAVPEKAAAGELVIAPDNRNVYISNRLAGDTDSIANFRILGGPLPTPAAANATSPAANTTSSANCPSPHAARRAVGITLELAGLTSTGGQNPRMFSIADDGQTLLIGNIKGDLAVVALKRNQDGSLPDKPSASIPMSAFPGGGPVFIQQIA